MISASDSVPVVPDRPSTPLGVAAAVLARRLGLLLDALLPSGVRVLLYGEAQGASRALELLEVELARADPVPWVVIRFSAWANQRRGPAVRGLVRAIQRDVEQQRRLSVRHPRAVSRAASRAISASRMARTLIAAGFAGLVVVLWQTGELQRVTGILATVAAAIGAFLVITRAGRDAVHWLTSPLAGRVAGNSDDVDFARELAVFVQRLDRPVAVLIDEVHPAKAEYVVELLDGIAAELRDVPIAFVIAADRLRLATMHEQDYRSSASAGEVLELWFHVTARVPSLVAAAVEDWQSLLATPGAAGADSEISASSPFSDLARESEILESLEQLSVSRGTPRRELGGGTTEPPDAPEVQNARVLASVAHLLPHDPRSFKRFLNAYALAHDFEVLRGSRLGESERRRLALWVILELRWPALADYLASHPDAVAEVGRSAPRGIPDELASLFTSAEATRVIEGESTDTGLDEDSIRALTRS